METNTRSRLHNSISVSTFIKLILFRDFVDGSSESEDTTYSESESYSSDSSNEVASKKGRPPVYKKSPVIVQTKSFSVTKVPLKKKLANKDRFYDRSRDIPNDVYFGDVNGKF